MKPIGLNLTSLKISSMYIDEDGGWTILKGCITSKYFICKTICAISSLHLSKKYEREKLMIQPTVKPLAHLKHSLLLFANICDLW